MTTYNFLGKLLRPKFEAMLRQMITSGRLEVILPDGAMIAAGESAADPIRVCVNDWATLCRLTLNPDLALGEGFMDGQIVPENRSIRDLLDLLTRNIGIHDPPGLSWMARLVFRVVKALWSHNDPARSKRNVAHHYDLDGRLYDLFLDADRQYSCAYFENPEDSLDLAQLAKKRHLAAKLALRPGQRVLDIGSGWGGLALYLARIADVSVKGITLSEEQIRHARQRAEGQDRVAFDLTDYRALDERFDRIVSVGMFEHVGLKSYGEFFSTLARLLEPEGVAVLHYIGRATPPSQTNPWVLKYIFPGGYMPALSEVLPVIEREGLIITDIEVLRLHYAETLRRWSLRFLANRDKAVALYDERFARMWEYYLAAAEMAFRHQGLVIHQIQLVRSQEVLPLTRGYIRAAEIRLQQDEQAAGPGLPAELAPGT
ncbi:MAG: cyclopropane-fatty-acyl-phospholipid synthase family protein [Gemmobacter sp.]|jgi:cyclopropane-fatty-acyl-phospholipid synthase|nr:cyclopropane-fatty-acyl-phospholipid synthase family protein [Gemmobacter sp.]